MFMNNLFYRSFTYNLITKYPATSSINYLVAKYPSILAL